MPAAISHFAPYENYSVTSSSRNLPVLSWAGDTHSWWAKKYAHLGKTTVEILGHAGSEHPHTILRA